MIDKCPKKLCYNWKQTIVAEKKDVRLREYLQFKLEKTIPRLPGGNE